MAGWGSFIVDQLRSFDGQGAVLRPETYEHLHTPLFGGTYVAGWGVVQRPWAGGDAFTHAGSNTQNFAVVWMAPRRKFAILIATNVGGDAAASACNEAAGALIHLAQGNGARGRDGRRRPRRLLDRTGLRIFGGSAPRSPAQRPIGYPAARAETAAAGMV